MCVALVSVRDVLGSTSDGGGKSSRIVERSTVSDNGSCRRQSDQCIHERAHRSMPVQLHCALFRRCNFTHSNLTISFDFEEGAWEQSRYLAAIGDAIIIVVYLQTAFWSVTAERQTKTIRQTLFRTILRKEISFFDTQSAGSLSTRLLDDVTRIHDGIGDKIGLAKGWQMTLVILVVSPVLFLSTMLFAKVDSGRSHSRPPSARSVLSSLTMDRSERNNGWCARSIFR